MLIEGVFPSFVLIITSVIGERLGNVLPGEPDCICEPLVSKTVIGGTYMLKVCAAESSPSVAWTATELFPPWAEVGTHSMVPLTWFIVIPSGLISNPYLNTSKSGSVAFTL